VKITRRSLPLFLAAVAASAAVKQEKERKPAPPFALKDASGKIVKLADLKGKVVLLNFWATWCGPCKIEIPWFIEMEGRLKGSGLAVVGVAMDEEGWELVKPHVEKLKVNYRMLLGNEEVAQAYGGVDSLPTTFLLDRSGRVASVHTGLVSKSVYENEVQELLKAKS
jgi:peroxiredoxin